MPSKLQALIDEFCPEGVEYQKLGEIADMARGTPIRKKGTIEGDIPVISGGRKPAYFHNTANREKGCIVVAGSGAYAGYISIWNEPIFVSDAFSIITKCITISQKFIFYFLKNMQPTLYSFQSGSGVPHVYIKNFKNIEIPVPPLIVQKELVKILDNFTELEAELEARKKQYKYYREQLLTFGKEMKFKKLGEIADMARGTPIRKKETIEGDIPVISGGRKPAYFHNEANRKKDSIVVAGSGAYAGFVSFWSKPVFVSDAFSIAADGKQLFQKYLYYFLKTMQTTLHSFQSGGGVPHVYIKDLKNLKIPIPPLSTQQKIVDQLDQFDALSNDINQGLPAEIKARSKQYEFYRNQLLTFKEKPQVVAN